MVKKTVEEIKKELEWIMEYENVHSVLLFGSYLEYDDPRDIDICIVTLNKPLDLEAYGSITLRAPKYYDISVFEELPLYIKIAIIEKHVILFSRDVNELYEYFYLFRKLWRDQYYRNRMSHEDILMVIERMMEELSRE